MKLFREIIKNKDDFKSKIIDPINTTLGNPDWLKDYPVYWKNTMLYETIATRFNERTIRYKETQFIALFKEIFIDSTPIFFTQSVQLIENELSKLTTNNELGVGTNSDSFSNQGVSSEPFGNKLGITDNVKSQSFNKFTQSYSNLNRLNNAYNLSKVRIGPNRIEWIGCFESLFNVYDNLKQNEKQGNEQNEINRLFADYMKITNKKIDDINKVYKVSDIVGGTNITITKNGKIYKITAKGSDYTGKTNEIIISNDVISIDKNNLDGLKKYYPITEIDKQMNQKLDINSTAASQAGTVLRYRKTPDPSTGNYDGEYVEVYSKKEVDDDYKVNEIKAGSGITINKTGKEYTINSTATGDVTKKYVDDKLATKVNLNLDNVTTTTADKDKILTSDGTNAIWKSIDSVPSPVNVLKTGTVEKAWSWECKAPRIGKNQPAGSYNYFQIKLKDAEGNFINLSTTKVTNIKFNPNVVVMFDDTTESSYFPTFEITENILKSVMKGISVYYIPTVGGANNRKTMGTFNFDVEKSDNYTLKITIQEVSEMVFKDVTTSINYISINTDGFNIVPTTVKYIGEELMPMNRAQIDLDNVNVGVKNKGKYLKVKTDGTLEYTSITIPTVKKREYYSNNTTISYKGFTKDDWYGVDSSIAGITPIEWKKKDGSALNLKTVVGAIKTITIPFTLKNPTIKKWGDNGEFIHMDELKLTYWEIDWVLNGNNLEYTKSFKIRLWNPADTEPNQYWKVHISFDVTLNPSETSLEFKPILYNIEGAYSNKTIRDNAWYPKWLVDGKTWAFNDMEMIVPQNSALLVFKEGQGGV